MRDKHYQKLSNTSKEDFKIPNILYKYRTCSDQHLKILEDLEVYFAPHRSFNVMHEHNLEYDYDSVTEDELLKVMYDFAETEFGITGHENKLEYAKSALKDTKFFDRDHQIQGEEMMDQIINKGKGVLSMSSNYDNENLWSTFSGGNTGYVVGFDSQFLYTEGIIECMAGYVKYYEEKDKPKLTPLASQNMSTVMDNAYKLIFFLPKNFQDEEEFRLSRVVEGRSRYYQVSPAYFMFIIFGRNMTTENKLRITEIRDRNFPKCQLIQQIYEESEERYLYTGYSPRLS